MNSNLSPALLNLFFVMFNVHHFSKKVSFYNGMATFMSLIIIPVNMGKFS